MKIEGQLSDLGEDVAAGRISEKEALRIAQTAEQKPKFTLGPLHVEKHNGRYEIWPKDSGEPHSFVGIAQREADGVLFASAPELAEALQAFLNTFPDTLVGLRDFSVVDLQDAIKLARSALSKLNG